MAPGRLNAKFMKTEGVPQGFCRNSYRLRERLAASVAETRDVQILSSGGTGEDSTSLYDEIKIIAELEAGRAALGHPGGESDFSNAETRCNLPLNLAPQGGRLIGSYDSQVTFGQSRVLLVWTRVTSCQMDAQLSWSAARCRCRKPLWSRGPGRPPLERVVGASRVVNPGLRRHRGEFRGGHW